MNIASSIMEGTFAPTIKANHYFNPKKANPSWAYFDEAKTKEYVSKANRRAKEIFDKQGNIFAIPSGQNEFDPNMKMSYTGTNYFYYTVPIADKI